MYPAFFFITIIHHTLAYGSWSFPGACWTTENSRVQAGGLHYFESQRGYANIRFETSKIEFRFSSRPLKMKLSFKQGTQQAFAMAERLCSSRVCWRTYMNFYSWCVSWFRVRDRKSCAQCFSAEAEAAASIAAGGADYSCINWTWRWSLGGTFCAFDVDVWVQAKTQGI